MDYKSAFREKMRSAGLSFEGEIIADGNLHRFRVEGDSSGSLNGWYVFHDGILPGGAYGCWKRGIKKNWCAKFDNEMTPVERSARLSQLKAIKEAQLKCRKDAKINAQITWNQGKLADNQYPYLVKKQVASYGLRVNANNRLMVPVHNRHGELCSLQFIAPFGDKKFLRGGSIWGNYYLIGEQERPNDPIYIGEGYATCMTIHQATGYAIVCAFNCGNLLPVARAIKEKYVEAKIIIAADNDAYTEGNPGLTKAKEAAASINAPLVYPKFSNPNDTSKPTDFNDLMLLEGLDRVRGMLKPTVTQHLKDQILPNPTTEVLPLRPEMLPSVIRDYVFDVAKRQQSPPDFVAVTAIVGLAGLIGCKALIRPKQNDDWVVVPNQWGAIVGRPSAMKTPSMKEALKPLRQIDANAAKVYEDEIRRFNAEQALEKIEYKDAQKNAKKMAASGNRTAAIGLLANLDLAASPPTRARLIVNDSTVEKLGELLNENPNGLILVRDELFGWLSTLTREDGQQDRSFYLECFDGNNHYTYDRIGRGTIEIKNCTLSIIGGIQPAKIASLVRDTARGFDDGLIQRFQLAVWPDDVTDWAWIDCEPSQEAKKRYFKAFEEMHTLHFWAESGAPKIFSFTKDAQSLFIGWMEKIQAIARSEDTHPMLESHLLKMPQTIAGLALIFELVSGGRESVGVTATSMAVSWADYLLSHARRLYGIAINQSLYGAHFILKRKSKLSSTFTAREIQRKGWANLDNAEVVSEALNWLLDYGYLISKELVSATGGRPTVTYGWSQKSQ